MKNRVGLDHSTKPVVVVDWHHTLEVEEEVSGRNSYALEMLTKVANEPESAGRHTSFHRQSGHPQ